MNKNPINASSAGAIILVKSRWLYISYIVKLVLDYNLESYLFYPFLLNITATLKVISIRLSTMLDEKFTLIIYNRLVALWSASGTVLLMYNASIFP